MSLRSKLERDGFAVVEDFFTPTETDEMKEEMARIIEEADFDQQHPISVFTNEHDQHAVDDYFLNSSDKICFFFEEGAVDAEGLLKVERQKAINKVGHGLHFHSPVFRRLTFHPKMKDLFRELDVVEPEVVQSMYIFKQPRIGGPVNEHVDATYLNVSPVEHLFGVWVAVDDSTVENGCLSFIPGSHKVPGVDYRFVRTHDTSGGHLLRFTGEKPVYDQTKFVPAPIKKGSLLLIHGLVIHKSEANTSETSRHAYTIHVMEKKDSTWSSDNWLQETDEHKFPNLYDTN